MQNSGLIAAETHGLLGPHHVGQLPRDQVRERLILSGAKPDDADAILAKLEGGLDWRPGFDNRLSEDAFFELWKTGERSVGE
jgi:hypothetical protein